MISTLPIRTGGGITHTLKLLPIYEENSKSRLFTDPELILVCELGISPAIGTSAKPIQLDAKVTVQMVRIEDQPKPAKKVEEKFERRDSDGLFDDPQYEL